MKIGIMTFLHYAYDAAPWDASIEGQGVECRPAPERELSRHYLRRAIGQ